jgi:Secretion system C-terminal sorting domain/IPT/TIG domain
MTVAIILPGEKMYYLCHSTNPSSPMIKLYTQFLALSIASLFSQQLFAINFPPPTNPIVSSWSPTSGTTGTVITFHGSHFTGINAVSFGEDSAASYSVVSDSVLTAVVGAGSTGSVILMNPNGWGGPVTMFTFIPLPPTPVIATVSPDTAYAGTTITIRGAHFTGANLVRFGGINAASFTVISDSLLTAVTGSGSSGYVDVITAGGMASQLGFLFVYPTPVITSFFPDSGATGTIVAIHGSNFINVDAVLFGGYGASSFNVLSDSIITAVVAGGSSGSVQVQATHGNGSLPGFTYIQSASDMVVTSFSPDSAGTGQTVTIHGSHFTGVDTVTFGGYGVYSLTVVSDTLITAVVGMGGSGSVSVEGSGKSASLGGFTFITTPSPNLAGPPLSLYPNPTAGSLQTASVPGTTAQSSQFELVDFNGRILEVIPVAPNTSQVQINTSGLNKGVYKLIWTDGKHTSDKTILVL